MFLWKNNENYPQIIPVTPPFLGLCVQILTCLKDMEQTQAGPLIKSCLIRTCLQQVIAIGEILDKHLFKICKHNYNVHKGNLFLKVQTWKSSRKVNST